jgi:G:T-mismatch repair DNA endonuclease (very short patch repair protein)
MEQNNILRANGYDVIEMWECEWNKIKETLPTKKELEYDARQQNINIRDALFGGRTEGFKNI